MATRAKRKLELPERASVMAPGYWCRISTPFESIGVKRHIQEYAALEYSAGVQSLVYYSASDGAVVYSIDWDGEASWRALIAASSLNPVSDAALAILVRHVDSPVYAMRLPA